MDLSAIGNMLTGVLDIAVLIIGIIFLGAVAYGVTFFLMQHRKYSQYKIIIWDKDGNEETDEGGIFVDKKTNNKRLFLRKNNVGLSPDNIPYKRQGNKKIIYMLREGLKNFRYIDVRVGEDKININVTEEDVNWAINSYERQKKLFQNSLLMQLAPFLALGFVSLVILIIFIYFFREFKTLKGVAEAFAKAASELAKASAETQVI